MPVPSTFDDLSETPSLNSPPGSEPVGTQANEYIQTAFAFIKQLRDGLLKPTAAVDFNGQKITNGAAATLSTTSKDFVIGSQMYKIGEVRMWHGAVADIATSWGAGWQLADGTNGTADLRDRFIVGAGATYTPNSTGGANTVALATANLPAHNHGVTDPGHVHSVSDPGHAHGVNDPGHRHQPDDGHSFLTNGTASNVVATASAAQAYDLRPFTNIAGTGITIQGAGSNIGINGASTGISTQNTGSGTAHENRPPYYALCFLEYVGA